jgi:predicted metal-binding protein
MPCQSADSIDRIRVVHKDQAAYDRVKRPIKLHFCRVAFEEFHIPKVSCLCACRCPLRGCSSAVGTNNLPSWSNQVGGQKSYVSTTATHVKNAHACVDPGLL